jgi:hypothetical protein
MNHPYSPYSSNLPFRSAVTNRAIEHQQQQLLEKQNNVNENASDNNLGSVHHINNWPLIITIFFLYPLFCYTFADAAFSTVSCSQVDLSASAAEQCENNNIMQQNLQYLTVLAMGAIGVVAAVLLAKNQHQYRSAAFGLLYGSFATILIAVFANFARLTGFAQVLIIGLLLSAFIFLPPLTSSILLT